MSFKISQSFLKDVNKFLCPKFLYFRHIEQMETPASDAMNKGKYFEHHLIGACRGEAPTYDRLKSGGLGQVEKDLIITIDYARDIMNKLGVDIKGGEAQLKLESELFSGHLDLVTNDFTDPSRKCIIDVKFTETAIDEKYRGWGGIETGGDNGSQAYLDAKIQALHYTKLYKDVRGEYVPFYFMIFGQHGKDLNSGEKKRWARVLKFEIMPSTLEEYENERLDQLQKTLHYFQSTGWKAKPEFNKCQICPFNLICKDKVSLPEIEKISV